MVLFDTKKLQLSPLRNVILRQYPILSTIIPIQNNIKLGIKEKKNAKTMLKIPIITFAILYL